MTNPADNLLRTLILKLGRVSRARKAATLALAITVNGCGSSSSSDRDGGNEPKEEKDWTVLVYGHGDHNLSNSLLRDLQEMAAARIDTAKVNVLALVDFDASQRSEALGGDRFPSGYSVLEFPGNGAEPREVGQGPELNLDEPAVIATLTEETFAKYPAKKRGVIFWDHGGAWSLGFGGDTQDGSLSRPRGVSVVELADALKRGLQAADVSAEPPLDFLAFDTCLMAGAEVVAEFADLARVYIADAEIDYGAGWDYNAAFSWLSSNSREDVTAFAVAEVDSWDAHHAQASVSDEFTRSHVALDLNEWDGVMTATKALVNEPGATAELIARGGYFSLPSYSNTGVVASGDQNLRDIGGFARRLSQAGSARATELLAALNGAVLKSSQGSLRSSSSQVGIHVEMPTGSAFTEVEGSYGTLAPAWNRQSSWSTLLHGLVKAADTTPPVLTQTAGAAGSRSVLFSAADPDTADALVLLATPLDDMLAFIGTVGYAPIEAGEQYEATWDGNVLLAGPPGAEQLVSVLPGLTGGEDTPPIWMMPLYWPEEEVLLGFLFSPEDSVARYAVLLDTQPAVFSTAELVELAGDMDLYPVFIGIDAQGESQSFTGPNPVRVAAQGVPLQLVPDAEDTFYAATLITDVWGNQQAELTEIQAGVE
ncbi:MAG TPA: clostripain-related cysteine peptidase [Polyangiaceae bacterium]|nr:clostripain-related cysteine peptidase [Polyangiaceae bacterium]